MKQQSIICLPKEPKALAVLRDGSAKTGDEALWQYYEEHRYVYKMSRNVYQDVTAPCNGGVQVKLDGKWGLRQQMERWSYLCV